MTNSSIFNTSCHWNPFCIVLVLVQIKTAVANPTKSPRLTHILQWYNDPNERWLKRPQSREHANTKTRSKENSPSANCRWKDAAPATIAGEENRWPRRKKRSGIIDHTFRCVRRWVGARNVGWRRPVDRTQRRRYWWSVAAVTAISGKWVDARNRSSRGRASTDRPPPHRRSGNGEESCVFADLDFSYQVGKGHGAVALSSVVTRNAVGNVDFWLVIASLCKCNDTWSLCAPNMLIAS